CARARSQVPRRAGSAENGVRFASPGTQGDESRVARELRIVISGLRGAGMQRTRSGLIESLARMPWPAGVAFGICGFVAVRYGLPAMLRGNPFGSAIAPMAVLISWVLLAMGLFGSALSWIGRRRRRRMLDAQDG